VDCSVDWIDGACLMLRRAALPEDGPFDERFFMYSEDEDLCWRLRKRGWLVCFCGTGTAFHKGAASSRLYRNEMLHHFYRSQLLFLTKHYGRHSTFFYTVLMKTILVLRIGSFATSVDAKRRASI
jgi:GT2 family glycosyltransferase